MIKAHVQWYLSNPGAEKLDENKATRTRVLNMNAGENVEKLSDKTEETSENKPEQTQPASTETEQPVQTKTEEPTKPKENNNRFWRFRR